MQKQSSEIQYTDMFSKKNLMKLLLIETAITKKILPEFQRLQI